MYELQGKEVLRPGPGVSDTTKSNDRAELRMGQPKASHMCQKWKCSVGQARVKDRLLGFGDLKISLVSSQVAKNGIEQRIRQSDAIAALFRG